MELFHKNLRIVPAKLGNDAGVIGNAELALDAGQLQALAS
jgi:adhesin HecA-like repeat protein